MSKLRKWLEDRNPEYLLKKGEKLKGTSDKNRQDLEKMVEDMLERSDRAEDLRGEIERVRSQADVHLQLAREATLRIKDSEIAEAVRELLAALSSVHAVELRTSDINEQERAIERFQQEADQLRSEMDDVDLVTDKMLSSTRRARLLSRWYVALPLLVAYVASTYYATRALLALRQDVSFIIGSTTRSPVVAGGVLLVGIISFAIRQNLPRIYGSIEITIGIIAGGYLGGTISGSPTVAQGLGLATSVYVVVRGLDNFMRGRKAAATPPEWKALLDKLTKTREARLAQEAKEAKAREPSVSEETES